MAGRCPDASRDQALLAERVAVTADAALTASSGAGDLMPAADLLDLGPSKAVRGVLAVGCPDVALSGAHALMRHASLSRSELWRSARASQVTIVSALRL